MNSKFSPNHYRQGAIEPWDFIVSQDMDFLTGNVIKYLTRAGKKDSETYLDDLLKAQTYLRKLIATHLDDDSTGPSRTSNSISKNNESEYGDILSLYNDSPEYFDR